jgi:acyl transferase domain-containing protein/NAD(P)-dependent dehydrogenase (short-subunit alcohol dehydrogenase family)
MSETHSTAVAIVGMACRFPGARNKDEFWRNLIAGRCSIEDVDLDVAAREVSSLGRADNYVAKHATLPNPDHFDADFFGFTARQAAITDPQQRVFLEVAWHSLEDAGWRHDRQRNVGVFVGANLSSHLTNSISSDLDRHLPADFIGKLVGNDKDYISLMTSYLLDLSGPSFGVQSACSSSLLAVSLAYQNLLTFQCDMALAGGVSVRVPFAHGYVYQEGNAFSRNGSCRPFDSQACGTVFGSGAGAVVLKRLQDAMEDGDRIYALIRGAGVTNDGRAKAGFTAPSVEGQRAAIEIAIECAGIDPAQFGYLETHGTATPLGDPIEFEALRLALGERGYRCALGAVKGNVGHLDSASGIAGLIKATLAIRQGVIPPTLGFAEPNRAIALDEQSRFYVNTSPAEWNDGAARIAGVSSFGFGGTNVHLVLGGASHLQKEGGKIGQPVAPKTSQHLLCVSAKTAGGLKRLANSYAILLDDELLDVNELCDGALLHRNPLPHRLAVSGTNAAMLKAGLSDEEGARATTYRSRGAVGKTGSRLAFLFGGQGLQEVGLGRELFAHDEVFRGAMDRCAGLIMQAGGEDPRELLYGASATNSDLALTRNTQSAMFALGYSLAAALESRSVIAHAMMGHSVGEITAACRAGWISLESAARLIVERSRIMDAAQKGGMLAVLASHEWVAELINKRQIPLSIAVVNGPQETVVAGSFEAVQQFAKHANSLGRSTKTLPVSHAFHSQLMEEAAVELGAIVLPPSISSGGVPVISNVTGAFYREAPDAGYWSTHIRSTVQFKAGLETLNRSGCECFVEIGGTGQLSRMARATLGESISTTTLLTTRTAADESFCRALADLFCLGQDISPAKAKVPQVSLPLYPFEPTKHQYIRASTPAQPIHDCNVCDEGALIDRELDLPASDEARFVGSVSLASHRHFEDHRIGESVIVPGAAFLSAFVDAWTRCRSPEGDIVLTDVQFPEGMLLSADESRLVHLVMDRRSDESRLCSLLSRATQMPQERPWQLHARALASPPRSHNWARHSLTEAEADCRERVPGDEFYRAFRNAGYHLGSSFSWIDSIAIGNHIGVASIRAPSGRSSQELLTCIIDSCFHVVHACRGVSVDRLAYDDDLYIPFSINQFSLRSPHLSGEVFHCIVRMRENSPSTEISADLTLIDEHGKPLMEIEGFVARTVDRRLLGRTPHQKFSHFSQVVWVPQDQGTRSVEPTGDSWLVFGGKAALCFDIGEALSQHGRSPVFITEGSKFAKLNNDSFEVRLDECGDLSAVLASLRNQGRRVEGAVHCLALDTSQADLEGARQFTRLRQVTLDSAVALSQAMLLDCDAAKPPKLAFVTRNAVATGLRDNDRIVPQAASLVGFARSISLEHAALGGICLDLGAEGSYSVDDVVKELLSPGSHRQVAYRDGRRLVAELNGSVRPVNGQRPALNGRWVITGGAGSIGLALAQCLASLGAKHIALLGRTAETSESLRAATTALTLQGCKVSFHAVDVTHRDALGVCLEEICLDGAGLEGLIHCAGVIDDRIVGNLDRDSIASVFDPKVEGAWNLHDALRGVPVGNFFVCSSAAGVVGAAGQSHYAAASAAVDALMTYRSATGQRSTSIVWGPWIDSSMFSALTDAQRRYLERQGHRLLTTEEAVGAFCDLLRTDNAQVGAFDIAAEKFIAAHAGADEGFFRRLAGKSRHNNGFEKRQPQAIDSESQLLATLIRNVEQAVGMALDPESAASRSPVDLGLVSLTAIEVREQFRAETGQDVPLSWLLSGETMRELAQRVWSSTRQKHEEHEDQIKRVVV